MAGFRLKFSSTVVWLLGTASLLVLEVCATTQRVLPPAMADPHSPVGHSVPGVVLAIGDLAADSGSVIVISNVGPVEEGEIEVTLKATPISGPVRQATTTTTEHRTNYVATSREQESSSHIRTLPKVESTPPQRERIYFLPTAIPGRQHDDAFVAVSCRLAAENQRARVYADQRVPQDSQLTELVTAIDSASASSIVDKIEQLIGFPCDLDGDGRLTIVVTPVLDRLGTTSAPVYGLTQPNDFVPEIDRPHGNQSDVIYLSSSLKPGEKLAAVLAHEWCHASVFSRHARRGNQNSDVDDDWFNEAIAHVVEVASSGSDSNIAHRVQSYLSHPAQSPLIVRDYCRPEYWRHHGCRGAGYLFLKWCLDEFPDAELSDLAGDLPLNLHALESTTHCSFEELFANWTRDLGKQLATGLGSDGKPGSAETPPLAHHTWKLDGANEQTLVIRIGGTCADFVHVQSVDVCRWQLSVETSTTARLRTSLLPIDVSAH